jgi:hypothetical protein
LLSLQSSILPIAGSGGYALARGTHPT